MTSPKPVQETQTADGGTDTTPKADDSRAAAPIRRDAAVPKDAADLDATVNAQLAEPAVFDDPCLHDNGGCASSEHCQSSEFQVTCSPCPPAVLDEDGSCGPALVELTVSSGELDSAFSSRQRTYRVSVPFTVQQLTFSARARSGAQIKINDSILRATPYRTGLLSVGETGFDIIVLGADGHDRRYILTVERQNRLPTYLKGDDTEDTDNFGRGMAVHGDLVAVGAIYADGIDNAVRDVGEVYVYKRVNDTYELITRLHPKESLPSAQFGAKLAMSDDTLFVNAPSVSFDRLSTGISPGRVHVFRREGDSFEEQPALEPSGREPNDWFGVSLALSGNTLAVGAPNGSAVYIYDRDGDAWLFSQRLTGADRSKFGAGLALQGDTLIVGAPEMSPVGEAYVYERRAGSFEGPVMLEPREPPPAPRFGHCAALFGNVAAVSAPGYLNPDFTHGGADAVYLFDRTANGWQARPLTLTSAESENSAFGHSMVLLSETTLAVGAFNTRAAEGVFGSGPGSDGARTGGTYLFADLGNGFVFDRLLNAPKADPGDWFGYDLATDGSVLGVTAPHEGSKSQRVNGDAADNSCDQCGAAYVFW